VSGYVASLVPPGDKITGVALKNVPAVRVRPRPGDTTLELAEQTFKVEHGSELRANALELHE